MKQVLVATRDTALAEAVGRGFGAGVRTDLAQRESEFRRLAANRRYDAVFVDLAFLPGTPGQDPGASGPDLSGLRAASPGCEVVVLAASGQVRAAVDAVRSGADGYLLSPPDSLAVDCVVGGLREVFRLEREMAYFLGNRGPEGPRRVTATRNPAMRLAYEQAVMVAPTISSVLLTGETGVGKGVMARFIHAVSNRGRGPFVTVPCGGTPDTLLESELFGHVKGAFTGAERRKTGRFEEAQGGTVFLDEVGTLSAQAQTKLLQVLQDKVFRPVGADRDLPVNARIVAATNLDLRAMVEAGQFRMDLYFRLNIFPINLPPLRQRREDIPLLAMDALHNLNALHRKAIASIHPDVLRAFARYSWPGNVRELHNLMERACILERGDTLSPACFPAELLGCAPGAGGAAVDITRTLAAFRDQAKAEAELAYLRRQLEAHRGRIGATAKAAGITPRQLHKLMRRHGLTKELFR